MNKIPNFWVNLYRVTIFKIKPLLNQIFYFCLKLFKNIWNFQTQIYDKIRTSTICINLRLWILNHKCFAYFVCLVTSFYWFSLLLIALQWFAAQKTNYCSIFQLKAFSLKKIQNLKFYNNLGELCEEHNPFLTNKRLQCWE